MKSNQTPKWVIFFPAILLFYIFESFIWMTIALHSVNAFSNKSWLDIDSNEAWEAAGYLFILPIIAGYLLSRMIYYLCPKPQIGARILAAFYLFYAGSIYLKPKVWNIGSLSALWYDGILFCFLVYVSFEKYEKKLSKQEAVKEIIDLQTELKEKVKPIKDKKEY